MKVFSKIAVIAAAFMLVSAFVSCKNDAEEGPGVVAEFATDNFYGLECPAVVTCFDDDTWEIVVDATKEKAIGQELTFATGTYKGDVTKKNADVTIVITSMLSGKGDTEPTEIPEEAQPSYDVKIQDDVLLLPYGSFKRK